MSAASVVVALSGERLRRKGRHGVVCRWNCVIHVWTLWEYACVLKWRYINTLPFLSFLTDGRLQTSVFAVFMSSIIVLICEHIIYSYNSISDHFVVQVMQSVCCVCPTKWHLTQIFGTHVHIDLKRSEFKVTSKKCSFFRVKVKSKKHFRFGGWKADYNRKL